MSYAEQPLDALRNGVNRGIQILEDPLYEDTSQKEAQQQRLWEVMLQVFDFREFSRRVLSSHWKKFSPQQREEFSRVFAEFLGKFYLRRLQARYNGEKIFYANQKLISKSRALVDVKVYWKNLEVPVELRMIKKNGTWKVYDLTALGINAVSNYRAQFRMLLQKNTPNQVIDIVKEKVRALDMES